MENELNSLLEKFNIARIDQSSNIRDILMTHSEKKKRIYAFMINVRFEYKSTNLFILLCRYTDSIVQRATLIRSIFQLICKKNPWKILQTAVQINRNNEEHNM